MNTPHYFELAVPIQPTDHNLGPRHAPITFVEYGDLECPNCKAAVPAVKLMLDHFASKLHFVFRHFPLEEVHPHALHAALAAEAAGGQGKFWPMHDLLFENQLHLKPNNLRAYAQKLELDMVRFDADMADELYLQRIREQIDGGSRSGVRATPTFFLNGKLLDVSYGLQALRSGIEAAMAKKP